MRKSKVIYSEKEEKQGIYTITTMPIKTLLVLCVSVGMPAAAGYVVVLGYGDDVVYTVCILTRTIRIELCFIMILSIYASLCCVICIRLVL